MPFLLLSNSEFIFFLNNSTTPIRLFLFLLFLTSLLKVGFSLYLMLCKGHTKKFPAIKNRMSHWNNGDGSAVPLEKLCKASPVNVDCEGFCHDPRAS